MKSISHISFIVVFTLLAGDDCAWALQSHSEPEGLYIHQMAHLLFAGALAYLFFHTRVTQGARDRGWRYLQIFCILLIGWNLLAFVGHDAYEHLLPAEFLEKNTLHEKLTWPMTPAKGFYYIAKLDHVLLIPALATLVLSLRSFYRKACRESDK